MPNSLNRMVKQHSGAGEAHDFADSFSHVFAVAVGWAFFAGSFLLAVFACCQPLVGVLFKGFAVVAELFVAFFFSAVQSDHQ